MNVIELHCPLCGARLRMREKLLAERTFACPECRTPVQVQKPSGSRNYVIVPVQAEASALCRQPGQPAARIRPRTPLRVGLGIALAVCVVLAVWWRDRPADPASSVRLANQAPRPEPADQRLAANDSDPPEAVIQPPESNDPPSRMQALGRLLGAPLERNGAFPAGAAAAPDLPVDQRFSWMAILAARKNPAMRVSIDDSLSWRHPRHDAFVRQRIPEFQNPAILTLVGADGYPASHFAGVAGVGEDAASLPAGDQRAGVFGYHRQTSLPEIRDGASNTLLILGVAQQLGCWAGAGPATVRGLAREPYVNGPDGFGTGQPESMLALMADGSVRALHAQTDPAVIRALAAMADGLPPPEAEHSAAPGDAVEPAARLPEAPEEISAWELDPHDPPLQPEFAPEAPRKVVDLAAALKLKISRFDQPRRPLADTLLIVADLLGAPIRLQSDPQDRWHPRLREPVALTMENCTLEQILTGLISQVGLTFRVEPDHIQLLPRN